MSLDDHDGLIGRQAELAAISSFLDDVPSGPAALLLEGQAGIGKTTLWSRSVAQAMHLFHFSNTYLALLFAAVAADPLVRALRT